MDDIRYRKKNSFDISTAGFSPASRHPARHLIFIYDNRQPTETIKN